MMVRCHTAFSSSTTTGPSGSPWPAHSNSRDTRSRVVDGVAALARTCRETFDALVVDG
jgi:hypothetical protein